MQVAHAPLHKALKSAWRICYALRHSVKLPEAQWSYERGLGLSTSDISIWWVNGSSSMFKWSLIMEADVIIVNGVL